jgi:hypothetical protein
VNGVDGADGAAGPNMIVASGVISGNGTVLQGYHVVSCTHVLDATTCSYTITLDGIAYDTTRYVTIITTSDRASDLYMADSGNLVIKLYSAANYQNPASEQIFSFMIMDTQLATS